MIVIAIDPGYEKSAWVAFNGVSVTGSGFDSNDVVLASIHEGFQGDVLLLEGVASYGMAVGKETFDTVFWSGRFVEAWMPGGWARVYRRDVKQHLCHTARATDANIRQALIDRFGPGTEKAIGRKKSPGPLYQITGHKIAALAVAVTWWDQFAHQPVEVRPGVQPEF